MGHEYIKFGVSSPQEMGFLDVLPGKRYQILETYFWRKMMKSHVDILVLNIRQEENQRANERIN